MEISGTLFLYVSGLVFSYLILILVKFVNKVWFYPIRLKSKMESQGIKGPAYKLLHGSIKEMVKFKDEVNASGSMELSDPVYPRLMPHVYAWSKLYGKNFLTWHGLKPRMIILESELIKDILHDKEGSYSKIDVPVYKLKLLGDGLATTTKGPNWSTLRKVANVAFHSQSLKGMIPGMVESVEMMLKRWRQNDVKEIEMFREFKMLTSEVIAKTAFGSSYQEGENIFNMLVNMAFIVARNDTKVAIPIISKFMKTSDDIESDKLEQGIYDSMMMIVSKREEDTKMGKVENYGDDYLGLLIRAYKNNKISIQTLIDECKTFYIAGYETTSSALTWIILLLAIHPEWQDKVRQEVFELFGQQNPDADNLGRLKLMNMVVNESLRVYPPAMDTLRVTKKEVRLGKLVIPANVEILISFLALHADPNLWGEDVHLFRPERFSEGIAKAAINNTAAFLPFGLGPRNCVGMTFVMAETKIVLSMILQRYKFTLSPNYVHSPCRVLTMCPQYGLPICFEAL